MIIPLILESSIQAPHSGEGTSLYNLTGNNPSQPMSTRDQELRKRRKKRLLELAAQCDRPFSARILKQVAASL